MTIWFELTKEELCDQRAGQLTLVRVWSLVCKRHMLLPECLRVGLVMNTKQKYTSEKQQKKNSTHWHFDLQQDSASWLFPDHMYIKEQSGGLIKSISLRFQGAVQSAPLKA